MSAVPDSLGQLLLSRITTPAQDVVAAARGGTGPLVVVSPHLDDAVLSFGATISRVVAAGVRVRVVTVLAGDPSSEHPADANMANNGCTTAGEAARVRRREDEHACRVLGAEPVWLPFLDSTDFPRNPDAIWSQLAGHLSDAAVVLIPGFPLEHADHDFVAHLVRSRASQDVPLWTYVEQPYASWRTLQPHRLGGGAGQRVADPRSAAPGSVPPGPRTTGAVNWFRCPLAPAHAQRKWVALGAYRSQLTDLRRCPRLRILLHELLAGGEYVGWLSGTGW